jgi:hypothetical protein
VTIWEETKMQKRKLGNSALEVSAIGMGCMNLSFGTGKAVNIKSVDLSLTSDDLQEIEKRLANIAIQGDRLSKELLSLSED